MGNFIDLTGKRFNRLLVLHRAPNRSGRVTMWFCRCDCGTEKPVASHELISAKTQSCGCLNLEINSRRMKEHNIGIKKHGLTDHPLRAIRKAMIDRCYNPNNKFYRCYGGRGVKVCDDWKDSLEMFYKWAIDNGWQKGLSLDRIDNDSEYCPNNCHWITRSENSKKPRSMNKGKLKEGIKDFCNKYNIQHNVARKLFDKYTEEQRMIYAHSRNGERKKFWGINGKGNSSTT